MNVLKCELRISDSEGEYPGTVSRDVTATLWAEGRQEKMVMVGTLTGKPGQLTVQSIDRDDLNLPANDEREALLSLHNQIYGIETGRVSLSFVEFEVETGDCLTLHRIANGLATAVWR